MVAWSEVSKVCRDYMERRSGYARTNFPYYALHDVPHLENVRHIGRELYLTLGPRDLRTIRFMRRFGTAPPILTTWAWPSALGSWTHWGSTRRR